MWQNVAGWFIGIFSLIVVIMFFRAINRWRSQNGSEPWPPRKPFW